MKENKLKKKELVVRVEKLIDQFSDLNSRLNQVSYEKVKQGIQLGQLGEDSASLQQQLGDIEAQLNQLVSTDSDLSEQCRILQEQISAPSIDSAADQQPSQEDLKQLALQLQTLQEQFQEVWQSLEHDRQSADLIANKSDDLRRDADELLGHVRRLEELGSELLVSDSQHELQIHGLQNDIAELTQRLQQNLSERETLKYETPQSLLQETTEPLREKLEQLSHLISKNSGQNRDIERRLSELAHRIGETGARIEQQQLERDRLDKGLEHRFSGLEAVIGTLKSTFEVVKAQSGALDELVKQVGFDIDAVKQVLAALQEKHRLQSDRDSDISARMDAFDDAMQAQSDLSQSAHDLINKLADELVGNRQAIGERLSAVDQRLSDYIKRESAQPDALAFMSGEIEGEREKFNQAIDKLKAEINILQSSLQTLDTDEHEVSDRLNRLAESVDQQVDQSGEIQLALTSTRDEISRSIAELLVRLSGAEERLSEQTETIQDQTQQLIKLAEAAAEQHSNAEAFERMMTALRADADGLKEDGHKLHQRLDEIKQNLRDENQKQDQVFQQLASLKQGQTELSEKSDYGIDSLKERLNSVSAQLAEQSGSSDGLSIRLDDLASTLEEQVRDLDSKHQRFAQNQSDYLERLIHQEGNSQTITKVLSELQTGHHRLLGKSDQQTTFLDALTAEYGKLQQESDKMKHKLERMGKQLESAGSTGLHHTKAIIGLSVLLLLLGLIGYWFVSGGIDDVERKVSLEMERYSEIYMTRDEIEQLQMTISSATAEHQIADRLDTEVITAIIKKQKDLEQQLTEIEDQFAASFETAEDGSTPVQDQMQPASTVELVEQKATHDSGQNAMTGNIDNTAAELTSLDELTQQIKKQSKSEQAWQVLRGNGGYTLQLLGVSNKQSIASFVNKHNLKGELANIEMELNGKKWYILLYGIYGTFSQATTALESLPEELKRNHPWIRSVPAEGILTPYESPPPHSFLDP